MGRKGYFKDDNCVHFKLIHNTGKDAEKAPTVMQAYIPERLAKKGVVEVRQDTLAEFEDSDDSEARSDEVSSDGESIDGDCYFPPDGYDYDQHLKLVNDNYIYQDPQIVAISNSVQLPPEDHDVLQALADEEDAFSEEDEDFFNDLCNNRTILPSKKLLWGDYEPLLPLIPTSTYRPPTSPSAAAPLADPEDDEDFEALLEDYADSQLGAGEYLSEDEDEDDHAAGQAIQRLARKPQIVDPVAERVAVLENAQVTRALLEAIPSDDEEACEIKIVRSKKDKWDCESILSFRSNISNHPSKISRPVRNLKSLKEESEEGENEVPDFLPEISSKETITRPRDETAEERRARKAAVKEAQAAARKSKHENEENARRAKIAKARKLAGNGDVRAGLSRCSL